MSNPLNQLAGLGQSIWYDNIDRQLLAGGQLARLIAEDSLTGLTSNPSIFEKAIGQTNQYDDDIRQFLRANPDAGVKDIYEALAIADIQAAADLLRGVYDETNGDDGYVSLEVSPELAHDTAGTIAEGERLAAAVDRPNLLIKVPATPAGIPAITALIGRGISVNVTLMFSLQHYDRVAYAYIAGLQQLAAKGGDLSKVASVASFFISRVDTLYDLKLNEIGTPTALGLRGHIAIANAKATYQRFHEVFAGEAFQTLVPQGARPQRPLWASTSTKNPAYRDVIYVEELIGPQTVNTMPPATVDAFRDHGRAEVRLTHDVAGAKTILIEAERLGLDYHALTEQLQSEGVAAFAKSFVSLLQTLAGKKETLRAIN